MKRIIFTILTLFLVFINIPTEAEQQYITKSIKTQAKDGFNICAELSYPKVKNQAEFPTVVLLHSLGYSSQWWGNIPQELLSNGFAVLKIDLRGHGNSIYTKKLAKISWKDMTTTAYAKYPEDVKSVLTYIIEEYPNRKFFNNWAIIGSDIGATTAILTADISDQKPKTIVMISPVTKTKGLYSPVALAQLSEVDILSITGANDTTSKTAENYLKKFAQKQFATYGSQSNASGMVLLKNDPELTKIITEWINQYLAAAPKAIGQ